MDVLTRLLVWLQVVINRLGDALLFPLAHLPGWLSVTLVSAVTGIVLLVLFKHTSNQQAIKRTRDDINAHLLALKLFKESALVALRAQGRILLGAFRLMLHAVLPMAVMALPVTLLLGQLSLWYQQRPLRIGEEAVVSLKLSDAPDSSLPEVRLEASSAATTVVGPVWIASQREVCWRIEGREAGCHQLTFQIGEVVATKEISIGEGFQRVSVCRPGWDLVEILLHPYESPFGRESLVQSIAIAYPSRESWIYGTDSWLLYWFVVSMIAALCFRRVFKVQV